MNDDTLLALVDAGASEADFALVEKIDAKLAADRRRATIERARRFRQWRARLSVADRRIGRREFLERLEAIEKSATHSPARRTAEICKSINHEPRQEQEPLK